MGVRDKTRQRRTTPLIRRISSDGEARRNKLKISLNFRYSQTLFLVTSDNAVKFVEINKLRTSSKSSVNLRITRQPTITHPRLRIQDEGYFQGRDRNIRVSIFCRILYPYRFASSYTVQLSGIIRVTSMRCNQNSAVIGEREKIPR